MNDDAAMYNFSLEINIHLQYPKLTWVFVSCVTFRIFNSGESLHRLGFNCDGVVQLGFAKREKLLVNCLKEKATFVLLYNEKLFSVALPCYFYHNLRKNNNCRSVYVNEMKIHQKIIRSGRNLADFHNYPNIYYRGGYTTSQSNQL